MNENNYQEKKAYNLILFAEFWEMFSFFGIVSIIVLYTSKFLYFNDQKSYLIYSVFLTLFCGLPILGGFIVDNFLTLFRSLIIGSLMMAVGNLLIGFRTEQFLYTGLTAIICGAAIFKPACTNFIGNLASKVHGVKPEKAYSNFYVVLNLGALFSPLIFGFLIFSSLSFSYCFYLSSFGLFCVSLLIAFHRNLILSFAEGSEFGDYKGYFMIFSTFLLTLFIIKRYEDFHNFIFVLTMIFFYIFHSIYKKQSELNRRNLLGLLGLLIFCMIFFAASLQVGSVLTLYLDRYVEKSIYGMSIPTSAFASLNPFFLILTAPIFQFLWKKLSQKNIEPSIVSKLSYGLIIGGLGFLFFLLSSIIVFKKIQVLCFLFIILGYICIGAGEICLSPPVLLALNLHAPNKFKNTMMGAWYLFMAFSSYLGGLVDILFIDRGSKILSESAPSIGVYQETFLFWGGLCIVAGLILVLFVRRFEIFDVLIVNIKNKCRTVDTISPASS